MKITILPRSPETVAAVRSVLNGEAGIDLTVATGRLGQFAASGAAPMPDLLIVETSEGRAELDVVERISAQSPRMAVILIATEASPEFLLEAMRTGVREVLSWPLQPELLQQALQRIRQRASLARGGQGKVLLFQPSKGGSGSTFIAANLAYALAMEGKRVALIDLNMQFGDASIHLSDATPQVSVADVAQQIDRLDGEFLASSMLRITPNLSVLASPDSPERSLGIRPESVERLLEVARENYDYVFVDVDRTLDPVSIRALDQADVLNVVLQLTLPFIRDAKRLLAVFDSLGYPRSKVRIIVNRYDKASEITLRDVKAALGVDISYTVPNSFAAVAASVNQGMPILKLNPNDRVAKALQDMALDLEPRATRETGGWLSRLFHKTA